MSQALVMDTQSRVDYVTELLKEESAKTGIPARVIFSPGRKARGAPARKARAAVWRKMRRAGWTFDAIAEAFRCSTTCITSSLIPK